MRFYAEIGSKMAEVSSRTLNQFTHSFTPASLHEDHGSNEQMNELLFSHACFSRITLSGHKTITD